jgi:excisionase family DNA binding protein
MVEDVHRTADVGRRNMRAATMTIETLRSAPSLVITRTDAAAALGVDPRTVTAGIENGTIPSVKLGRRVLIPREKFLKIFAPDD